MCPAHDCVARLCGHRNISMYDPLHTWIGFNIAYGMGTRDVSDKSVIDEVLFII